MKSTEGSEIPVRRRILRDLELAQYIAAILFGAGLNIAVGFTFVPASLYQLLNIAGLIPKQFQYYVPTPEDMIILSLAYFGIGIAYSIMSSLAFEPKRIVSPRQIQVASAGLFGLNWLALLGAFPATTWVQYTFISAVFFSIAFLIFGIIGIPQTTIIKTLIGLNGSIADFSYENYYVYRRVEEVSNYLSSYLPDEWELERKQFKQRTFLFRSDSSKKHQIFILLCTDPSDQNLTQMAIVCYIKRTYAITPEYQDDFDAKMQAIVRILRSNHITCKIEETNLNPAQAKVFHYAQRVLEAKIFGLKEMPRRAIVVILIFSAIASVLSYLRYYDGLPESSYLEFWIIGGLYMAVEWLPNLRPRHRKWKRPILTTQSASP